MSRLLPRCSLLMALVLLAGCAGSEQTTTNEPTVTSSPAPSPTQQQTAERPTPNPVPLPDAFEQAIEQRTRTRTGEPGSGYWQQEATYDLTARLFPEEKRIEGSGQMTYTNNAPNALQRIHMELIQNVHAKGELRLEPAEVTGGIELERISYNGQRLDTANSLQEPGYTVRGTQLVLVLPQPLASGETAEVEAAWSFTIPQRGGSGSNSGRMGYSPAEGKANLFYIGYWYPIFSVYDDVNGWFTEQFLGRAEFYMGYADYNVTIEAPEEWLVMATGELQNPDEVLAGDVAQRMRKAHQSDEPVRVVTEANFGAAATADGNEDGRLTWSFEAGNVRDVAFSASTQVHWEAARTPVGDRDDDGQVDYTHINTFWRDTAPLWSEVTRYQQDVITHHSEYTGVPYPWPHMTAVEGGGIIGGGMEYPMMTLMGDYNTRGDTALYAVTAHELGHMWVPMIVGVNERRFAWIDEGMTTFLENQAKEAYYGRDFELGDQQTYARIARADLEGEMMHESNWHVLGPAYTIASYYKPATLLTALRSLLGEETFMEAYRTFHERWAYKHPYPYDLFNTFEDAAGRELDWFWRSFYFETWTLDQAIADVSRQDGQTTIRIEDQGKAPMPVDLAITLENGETLRRTIPVDRWLNGQTTATLTLNPDAPVERVEIDPERDFPDVDPSDNVWQRSTSG